MCGRAIYIRPTSLVMPVGYNKMKVLYLHGIEYKIMMNEWIAGLKLLPVTSNDHKTDELPEPQEPWRCKTKCLLHTKERVSNNLQLQTNESEFVHSYNWKKANMIAISIRMQVLMQWTSDGSMNLTGFTSEISLIYIAL